MFKYLPELGVTPRVLTKAALQNKTISQKIVKK